MWAGLALAVACASDPAPPAPAAKDATRTWRRIGSTADGAAPEAATAEAARCASPCVAELWEPTSDASAATSIVLLRSDSEMRAADRRGVWQTTWRGLSGTLALCLGDPLATPPAGDPAGFRLLHAREGQWAWSVHLSGANPCGLDGQIELAAHGHRVRTHDLRAATLPWADGGREAAAAVARRLARAAAADRWPKADEAERARIIAALAKDPEAAPLVRRLEASP